MATPPRQLSPDGMFYWDGQRWLPVQSQPTEWAAPRWSPDGRYWWDGFRWVPTNAAPAMVWEPSPGLRPFLIVMLVTADLVTGSFALFGLLALAQYLGFLGGSQSSASTGAGEYGLMVFFVLLFALTVAATIGVIRRSAWSRLLALVAGAVLSLTCLGLVLGIPILVSAARAPLKQRIQSSAASP